MMGRPVDDSEAETMLKLWGLSNRVGGPRGYPKTSAHVLVARGKEADWTNHKVELVGWVVQHLDDEYRVIIKLYFEPQADGKRCSERKIRKITGASKGKISEAIDRCVGKVSVALSLPQIFDDYKKSLQMSAQ